MAAPDYRDFAKWAIFAATDPPVPAKPKRRTFVWTSPDGKVHETYEDNPDYVVREDGRIEHLCSHGVGHPVGMLRGRRWDATWMGIHGCDGCCRLVLPEGCEEVKK